MIRIDFNSAEKSFVTTPNVMTMDNPLEYTRLVLDKEMRDRIDVENNLEEWLKRKINGIIYHAVIYLFQTKNLSYRKEFRIL